MNLRIFLVKKAAFQTEAVALLNDIQHTLHLPQVKQLTIYDGFDVFGLPSDFADNDATVNNAAVDYREALIWQVLGDPTTDDLLDQLPDDLSGDLSSEGRFCLSLEYLPGQFDQRADAAEQAARLISDALADTRITSFKTYCFTGQLSPSEREKITRYLLNPVDSRLKDLNRLVIDDVTPADPVEVIAGFTAMDAPQLAAFKASIGLALTDADMAFIQQYFQGEGRQPTETEIRVLDTYWSDHCRHTTFLTELSSITFNAGPLQKQLQASFDAYLAARNAAGIAARPITLMDLATINARHLRHQGQLDNVEISDEINACSVFVDVKAGAETEKWLLQFKNETHNHPTEIEPYGGASTCLGGAIRDPLSGRAFVYQAVRVSGAASPLEPVEKTLPGKLPQIKITKGAAQGFSAYGNQIGVATTQVAEIYHEGYKAKRMEVGAVVAATPAENVVRQAPTPGDKIILLGGKTGRDGCGGASGSSKAHTAESLEKSGAEVQKGNPPVERAIQRLFRDPSVAQQIKKCNDFGAGGVCVAVGELADGLLIDLDQVPTKYAGLSGTELTISESQERMAVVVAPEAVESFIAACQRENTLAVVIAEVTEEKRMVIRHQGRDIVNLTREFIDSAGAPQSQPTVVVQGEYGESPFVGAAFAQASGAETNESNETNETHAGTCTDLLARLGELTNASQRGLQDMFDSNVGASTVLLPYGGKTQNSPAEGSVQLLPKANTSTASVMTYGFNADIASYSPYLGGAYAVVESVCRQVALGANPADIHLSFQEYFERLGDNPEKWGKPFAALLGAFSAQSAFDLAAIGGKDSMSGSFGELHVPPTLISFAVSAMDASQVKSSELKAPNEYIYLLPHTPNDDGTPNYGQLNRHIRWLASQTALTSIITVKQSGAAVELAKAAFGNEIGFAIKGDESALFGMGYGSFVLCSPKPLESVDLASELVHLGQTTGDKTVVVNGRHYTLKDLLAAYLAPLAAVFPLFPEVEKQTVVSYAAPEKSTDSLSVHLAQHTTNQAANQAGNQAARPAVNSPRKPLSRSVKPRVFIPVFPGMNSEYDMANAFARNGAETYQQPFVNLSNDATSASLSAFCKALDNSQILALSGGFSAGDEPNGSGKYMAMVLKNAAVQDAIARFLSQGGLILGICNGFQALVKCGLLPYGEIRNRTSADLTLAHNNSHRHIARIATTRVCHNRSPWLAHFNAGDLHDVAFSHGEGRLVVDENLLATLVARGQIATQYADVAGQATLDPRFNPNGSTAAIEGLISPCGQILGKMGHSERYAPHCYKNYPHFRPQNIFAAGVAYFK
ncbi:phosphoribosylformylglycinamidine synthase [Ostreibacterium oceani]|uniref:Phosphoribosylformylglycinamidine synthase n=1 Tax=Ostreibacterium oceani TaxID=2654998 RepID=A0A6N7EXA1_9GAMM|nr:phosphoribosylformylglycinamidine synthase [Ostreibacterium oceani]MPV86170.1 phosphoribosylformylglycinamidine synthase [Ostreibacterium oceani]